MSHSLQFLVLTMAGWLNRQQEDLIDCLREENRVLREQFGDRPLRLTDAQRRRLAVRGKRLRRQALARVAGIVWRFSESEARGVFDLSTRLTRPTIRS